MDKTEKDLSYDFRYWQCRIRQSSVRHGDGRPTQGMCPHVTAGNNLRLGQIISLITKKSPENATAQFKHTVKKTLDPVERWESAINFMAESYYQNPDDFSDEITALFGPGSKVCAELIKIGKCILDFEQNNRHFRIPCKVLDLSPDHKRYQATYWHNSLFNPAIPDGIHVLAFIPEWPEARTEKLTPD